MYIICMNTQNCSQKIKYIIYPSYKQDERYGLLIENVIFNCFVPCNIYLNSVLAFLNMQHCTVYLIQDSVLTACIQAVFIMLTEESVNGFL